MRERDEWRDQAQCLGIEMQPNRASAADVAKLKSVCVGCPVRRECRELAVAHGPAYGVHDGEWMGPAPMSPHEFPCEWCSGPIEVQDTGRNTRRFCKAACRLAAHRAREASGQDTSALSA